MPENKKEPVIQDFKLHAQPVDECDQAATSPEGLLHTLGNVSEWTESPALYMVDGKPRVLTWQWQAKGYCFYAIAPDAERLGLSVQVQMPQATGNWYIGFRCAKSKAP
jgi:formylglycine-generating enzyme required for sulfatase activity